MQSPWSSNKGGVSDDIVNATMTELAFLLLFTVGFLTYFIGDALSNAIGGAKPSCLFEYDTEGQRMTEERAVIKITIFPDKIAIKGNVKDHRHIDGAKKLVGDVDFKWLKERKSFRYIEVQKLIEHIEKINFKTSQKDNAINRSCRFYALYEIHMPLPKGKMTNNHLQKYVRTKDVLNKLSITALAANEQIVKGILNAIDAQTPVHEIEGHLLLLNGSKGGPYLVIE